jgi:hypothetical protein
LAASFSEYGTFSPSIPPLKDVSRLVKRHRRSLWLEPAFVDLDWRRGSMS